MAVEVELWDSPECKLVLHCQDQDYSCGVGEKETEEGGEKRKRGKNEKWEELKPERERKREV